MNIQHKNMAEGRWEQLSIFEQLGNVGSEIERTMSWRKKGNEPYAVKAFERALELIDFTIKDKKNRSRLRELTRTREALVDHYVYNNEYNTTNDQWHRYFFAFAYAAQAHRSTLRSSS